MYYRWVSPPAAEGEPVGAVLVVHGYSEHAGKYAAVLEALGNAGFVALASDHRGHGRTARVPGDLEHRERVLADLALADQRLAALAPGVPRFLLGHSLGAAFALRHLERAGATYAGAVLNGVALAIPASIPRAARLAARVLARVVPRLPLQSFFDPTRNTRDPVAQQVLRDDPLGYRGRIRVGTAVEVMQLLAEVRADLPSVRVPLLLTHGEADRHVPVQVARDVLAAVGSADKELRVWPALLHETWREPEGPEVIAGWIAWMLARARAPGVP